MSTAAQFAAKAAQLGPAVREGQTRGVRAGALRATTIIREEINGAVPSGRLKMNGKPKRVGAGFRMLAGSAAKISAQGPLHLVERDTSAHYEPRDATSSRVSYRLRGGRLTATEKKRRGRAGKAKGVSVPGIGFRRFVIHPGTTGKHPFERGQLRARTEVGRIILDEVADGIRAVLR
ncbi:hypothetical protein [Klenkia brasiliensis]|uniref:Phage protein, HK97 gp10 family n=1 Tax=Klenkia brasiliensis TaxID=333142 RepID=A0A1G7YG01_9ACTN|nr:hypothetical protein [Klenkia brasiliensis]SDG95276.1 hypothetical protein SAMN05660324_3940 [Klenkia brasiliensis]